MKNTADDENEWRMRPEAARTVERFPRDGGTASGSVVSSDESAIHRKPSLLPAAIQIMDIADKNSK
jgi:hypothetical protein